MPENRNHHYVPQMYMYLFSQPGDHRVGVYVIDRDKFICNAPIRGQACRSYFYGKNPRTEQAFGNLEGQVSRIFYEARNNSQLPLPGSQEHEWLSLYLVMQHVRTVGAANKHNVKSEKMAKAILRHKAEFEGNNAILAALDRVKITRKNAVSELVGYGTIVAPLLFDLTFMLIQNCTSLPFIGSDTPVVLHNRLYESQHISVTGYANVGLQIFLPLGPRLAVFGFDSEAYAVQTNAGGIVKIEHDEQIRLINDLQWEAADAVLIVSPLMSAQVLQASALYWSRIRRTERTISLEEIVSQTSNEARTRYATGEAPSKVSLNLPFVTSKLPKPARLGPWEAPPVRNADLVARIDRAFDSFR